VPSLAEALQFARDPRTTPVQLRRACEILFLDASGSPETVRARLLAYLETQNAENPVVSLNPNLMNP